MAGLSLQPNFLRDDEYKALCDAAGGGSAKTTGQYLRLTNEGGRQVLKREDAGGILGFFKRLFNPSEYKLSTISNYLGTKKIPPQTDQQAPKTVVDWLNRKVEEHNRKKHDTIATIPLEKIYTPPKIPGNFPLGGLSFDDEISESEQQVLDVASQALNRGASCIKEPIFADVQNEDHDNEKDLSQAPQAPGSPFKELISADIHNEDEDDDNEEDFSQAPHAPGGPVMDPARKLMQADSKEAERRRFLPKRMTDND